MLSCRDSARLQQQSMLLLLQVSAPEGGSGEGLGSYQLVNSVQTILSRAEQRGSVIYDVSRNEGKESQKEVLVSREGVSLNIRQFRVSVVVFSSPPDGSTLRRTRI